MVKLYSIWVFPILTHILFQQIKFHACSICCGTSVFDIKISIICHGKLFHILNFSSAIIIYIVQMCTYELKKYYSSLLY